MISRIERANGLGRADRHVELDIGNAERDAAEARGVRLVAAHAIAPGAGRLDMVVVLAERERRALELACATGEPREQRLAARDHDAGMAAQHLRLPVGRWNWLRPTLTHMLVSDTIR